MRNLRRLAGTRRPNTGGSTPDDDSLVTLPELGAVEIGLGKLWWRLTAITRRSQCRQVRQLHVHGHLMEDGAREGRCDP
jgi:hypothetical protein